MQQELLPQLNNLTVGDPTRANAPKPVEAAPQVPQLGESPLPEVAKPIRMPVEVVRAVAEQRPDSGYAQFEWGKAQLESGKEEEAFESFSRALDAENPEITPDSLVAHAGMASRLGMPDVARRSAQRALELDPENQAADAIFRLSRQAAPTMKIPSRPEKSGDIPETAPHSAETKREYADQQKDAPPFDKYEAIAKSDISTKQAQKKLQEKRFEEAHDLASKGIKENPENAHAWSLRALANYQLGGFQESLQDIQQAIALAPKNRSALLIRGRTLNKLGRYPEAKRDAETLLAAQINDFRAYLVKAHADAGLKNRDETLKSLSRAARFNPKLKPLYDRALRLPEDQSLLSLFDDAVEMENPASTGPQKSDEKPQIHWVPIATGIGGLLLLAVGLRGKKSKRDAPPAEGTRLGDTWYSVVREVGRGGMGVVYEARDLALDRTVALKKIKDDLKSNPVECERFLSEARLVAKLKHPGIVEVYSIIDGDEDFYMVLEFVEGKTLSQLLHERGKCEFQETVKILREAATAVDYAHGKGIVHRDLKPSNIMIARDGTVKVMDFGIARQAKDALESMAMTQSIAGTPLYMAPEQERGLVCRQSDVFALGVCFYEMLAGSYPFKGQAAGLSLNKIEGRYEPLSRLVGDGLPQGTDAVVAKALHPDPRQRFSSAREFVDALDKIPAV